QRSRDEDVRAKLLLREVVGQALEAEAALHGESAERPPILSVDRRDVLILFLLRPLVSVHRELIRDAIPEVVLQLAVIVVGVRSPRVVEVRAETKFRRV